MAKRKVFGVALVGVAVCFLMAGPAFAAIIAVGDVVKLTSEAYRPPYGGGLFDAYVNNSKTVYFKTWCLETNESFDWNTNYRVDSVGDVVAGGSGGPQPDPISMQTAWLYRNFVDGTLAGTYSFDITSGFDQMGVQHAIWFFEEENGYTGAGLAAKWVAAATANATAADLNFVTAFNPVDVKTEVAKQSMLVSTISKVSEPGTLGLLGLGLATLGLISRRRAKRME